MNVDGGRKGLFLKPLKPAVPDLFPDCSAVFLFDTRQLSFFPRLQVKRRRFCLHQLSTAVLINSEPLSSRNSKTGKEAAVLTSVRALKIQEWALLRKEWNSIQPEMASAEVKVGTY